MKRTLIVSIVIFITACVLAGVYAIVMRPAKVATHEVLVKQYTDIVNCRHDYGARICTGEVLEELNSCLLVRVYNAAGKVVATEWMLKDGQPSGNYRLTFDPTPSPSFVVSHSTVSVLASDWDAQHRSRGTMPTSHGYMTQQQQQSVEQLLEQLQKKAEAL